MRTDDLSPIDAVIRSWELTQDWLRQEMEEIRRLREKIRASVDAEEPIHRHRPMFVNGDLTHTPGDHGETEVDLQCTTCGLTEHLIMPPKPVSAREAAYYLGWMVELQGSELSEKRILAATRGTHRLKRVTSHGIIERQKSVEVRTKTGWVETTDVTTSNFERTFQG